MPTLNSEVSYIYKIFIFIKLITYVIDIYYEPILGHTNFYCLDQQHKYSVQPPLSA